MLKIKPSLILALDMGDQLIYEKLEQRRFDKVTGQYHYILSNPIKDPVVLNRLEHRYEDTHPYIKKKLLEYRAFMQDFSADYPNQNQLIRINVEQPHKDIAKNFQEAIELTQ